MSRVTVQSNTGPLCEEEDGWLRDIMMGGGNGVASVIMLTFPSEP